MRDGAAAGSSGLIGGSRMKGLGNWGRVFRKMEPQNTQNKMAAVVYRSRTMRLISRRGLPKLSSRQRCKPVAFR